MRMIIIIISNDELEEEFGEQGLGVEGGEDEEDEEAEDGGGESEEEEETCQVCLDR